MGLIEILIILGVSLAAGVGTVEYQKARMEPAPFQSPAPGFEMQAQPYLFNPKITSERGKV